MNSKEKILFTCAGGDAFQYLAERLKNKYEVFLVNASDQSFICKLAGFPFAKVPMGDDPSYISEIKKLIKKWKIDFIVPGADEELLPLAMAFETGDFSVVVMPTLEFTGFAFDKKEMAKVLAARNISKLRPFEKISNVKYPAVAKPIFGHGSRSFHVINNSNELGGYLKLYGKCFDEIVVEPYIAGDEYTISVIVNNKNKLIGIVPKKIILKRGITRAAVSEKNAIIERACRRIVAEFNPCGPFNVQLKLFKGGIYIFEINPRLSTTAVLTERCFGNEVAVFIKYHNQEKIINPPALKAPIYFYRYDENYFF